MKLNLKIAKILVKLINGESIPNSSVKGRLIDDLVDENIIYRKGKHKKSLELINEEALHTYLFNQLEINNLYDFINLLEKPISSRAESTRITADSKVSNERAFKGFLVNSYRSVVAELNNNVIIIHPQVGSFIFIYDYESFTIPKEITVVGVENAKNFSEIHKQKNLFKNINPIFISRYPQNQNKDFIKWMNSIKNNYLHFGDFDFAGIGIYINEYKKHLSERASLFIPENIKNDLKKGSRARYDKQRINFEIADIQEPKVLELIELIKKEKKGLDQEYYINSNL